jgi:flavin-dependent dehydrogenase
MALLYERFLEHAIRAGVEWMPGTQFLDARRMKHHSILILKHSEARIYAATRYLVGADGACSRVASALQLDENREWIVGVEEVLEHVPLVGRPRFHCFLDPRLAPGYLAWAVHDGEQVHVGVGGYPQRFDPLAALTQFRAGLGAIIVDLSGARVIEKRGGRIPVGGVLRHLANRSGLLLGDAAGAVSPLTAGGLDPCLRLSQYAAQVISEYLRDGRREVLTAYSGELFRARFVSRLWMRRLIRTIRSQELMEIGCAMMRLPLLNSFAHHIFFGRGSFPDLNPTVRTTAADSASALRF